MSNRNKKTQLRFTDESRTRAKDIKNVFKFAESIENLGCQTPSGATTALWLRGQADCEWVLQPTIGRDSALWLGLKLEQDKNWDLVGRTGKRINLTEYRLLARFRRYAHAFYKRKLDLWENITAAQHHNLPTRLLDWTSNPLVALYFAAESHGNKDGAVFTFRPRLGEDQYLTVYRDEASYNDYINDPLKVKGIKMLYPMMSTERLIAQSGAFTIQDPYTPLERWAGRKFLERELDVVEVFKWRVPKECKVELLLQLCRLGITHRTLFPDLHNLGIGLVREKLVSTEVLNRNKRP